MKSKIIENIKINFDRNNNLLLVDELEISFSNYIMINFSTFEFAQEFNRYTESKKVIIEFEDYFRKREKLNDTESVYF